MGNQTSDTAAGPGQKGPDTLKKNERLELAKRGLESLPLDLWKYYETLKYLDVGDNSLSRDNTGTLSSLGNFQVLETLKLNGNKLAMLPPELCSIYSLTHLDLIGNSLTNLPRTFSQLSALKWLLLSDNQVNSSAMKILGEMESLERLELVQNSLTLASFPQTVKWNNLETLDLSNNSLTQIPTCLCTLTSLRTLILSYNKLSNISAEFGNLINLTMLDLSSNSIEVTKKTKKQTQKTNQKKKRITCKSPLVFTSSF
jgi:Leucine-rich repeat (LRR) protein